MAIDSEIEIRRVSRATESFTESFHRLINAVIVSGGAVGFARGISQKQSHALIHEILSYRKTYFLGAFTDKVLIGCGYLAYPERGLSRHVGEIRKMMVSPSRRRQGIARRILSTLVARGRAEKLDSLILDVRANQEAAIALYESCDFQIVGKLRRFIRTGDLYYDNLWMQRNLNEAI